MANATTAQKEPISRMGIMTAIGVMIALIVDGMDMQLLSLSLPVLMKDFHLTTVQGGALGTYTLAGMGIGGLLASWLSDRLGRVRLVLWSLVFFSIMTCALGFTQSYNQFAFIRFLSGFGISAVWMCGTMVVAEFIPTSRRTTVLAILQAGWSIGYIIAAFVSAWILPAYGWRPMFIASIIPSAIAFSLLYRLEDPPSWIAARDARLAAAAAGKAENKNEWAIIWGNPKVRRNFLIWGVGAAMLQVAYFGANNWLPSYLVKDLGVNLKSMGWYISATYFMMVIGKIAAGYLSDLIGRRITWALSGVLTAAALPIIMTYSTASNVAYFLLLFGLLYGAPYAIVATYMSESFPTAVRGTAYGTSYNLGRILSIASPIMIGYVATQYSIGYGIALLGIAYFIMGVVPSWFIPEKMFDPKSTDLSNTAVTPTSGKASTSA